MAKVECIIELSILHITTKVVTERKWKSTGSEQMNHCLLWKKVVKHYKDVYSIALLLLTRQDCALNCIDLLAKDFAIFSCFALLVMH